MYFQCCLRQIAYSLTLQVLELKNRYSLLCEVWVKIHALYVILRLVLLSSSLIGGSTLGKDLSFLKKYFHLESVYVLLGYFLFYKVTLFITNLLSCHLSKKKFYS